MGFWHIGLWEGRQERAQAGLDREVEDDRIWDEVNEYTIEREFGETTMVWWYRWRKNRKVRVRTRRLPTT